MTARTQRERVLDALRRAGRHGVAQPAFLLPNVCDGGAPITRLASRIDELRQAGFRIEHAGRRNRCTVYRLTREPGPPARRAPAAPESDGAPEPGVLFEAPAPAPRSAFNPWTEGA